MNEPGNDNTVIRARGIAKRYEGGRIAALDGVSFEVQRGEFVAICGPSGCGKTTLLNIISAIDRPDEGALAVHGRDLATLGDTEADLFRRREVGLIFQLHNLLPHLTAAENVQVPLIAARVPRRERAERAADLLHKVGLSTRMHALPSRLSGGERQRVAICRALVHSPGILLADEPTGALDSRSGSQLFDLLEHLRATSGMTLVVVTHDPRIASRAQRVVEMLDGRIVNGVA